MRRFATAFAGFLAIACLAVGPVHAQWDMSPVASTWDMRPGDPKHYAWEMSPQVPVRLAVWSMTPLDPLSLPDGNAAKRPIVYVFAPYWSSESRDALPEIRQLEVDYELRFEYDDTRFPAHIRAKASATDGGGYPILWWAAKADKGSIAVWKDAATFCQQFEMSTAPEPESAQRDGGYPIHRQRYDVVVTRNGKLVHTWSPTKAEVIEHLTNHRSHASAGFDPTYLEQLDLAELLSLHDDHHLGKVQWAYVRRSEWAPVVQKQQPVATRTVVTAVMPARACPGGKCPLFRRG